MTDQEMNDILHWLDYGEGTSVIDRIAEQRVNDALYELSKRGNVVASSVEAQRLPRHAISLAWPMDYDETGAPTSWEYPPHSKKSLDYASMSPKEIDDTVYQLRYTMPQNAFNVDDYVEMWRAGKQGRIANWDHVENPILDYPYYAHLKSKDLEARNRLWEMNGELSWASGDYYKKLLKEKAALEARRPLPPRPTMFSKEGWKFIRGK